MLRYCVPVLVAAIALTGCNQPKAARLNAPPHGYAEKTVDSQGTFVYMTDNALLADMSVSDMHFLPHRAKLTTLGRERVCRLAQLVEAHGGSIRLSSDLADEPLVNQRLETVRELLAKSGLTLGTDTVVLDLPGGEGIRAGDALAIRAEAAKLPVAKSSGAKSAAATPGAAGGASDSQTKP